MAEKALYIGTGRRKNAVARVRLIPGSGKITVNGRDALEYFGREALVNFAKTPFKATDTVDHFDVVARLDGERALWFGVADKDFTHPDAGLAITVEPVP